MIQQLLTFARKDVVHIQPIPLTPFIKETLKFLRTSVPERYNTVTSGVDEFGEQCPRCAGGRGLAIIFATGYDKNMQDHLDGEIVLGKPFSIVEMSHFMNV